MNHLTKNDQNRHTTVVKSIQAPRILAICLASSTGSSPMTQATLRMTNMKAVIVEMILNMPNSIFDSFKLRS